MGQPIANPGERGSICKDIGSFSCRGRPGNAFIWVVDVGVEPRYGADPGGVPPPGGKAANEKTPKEAAVWGLVLTSETGGPAGRAKGDRDLHWESE